MRNRNGSSSTDRKPSEGVFVVERPWWDDCDKRKGGASEADVDGELDILQEVANEEGDGLVGVSCVNSGGSATEALSA